MHKEIIIDGVDVSECEDFSIGHSSGSLDKYRCNIDSTVAWSLNCKDNFNCYYKQLARKTQECELAEQLIAGILKVLNLEAYDWHTDQNEIITEIKAFKHKCEELKKQIKQLKDTIKREKEAGYSIIERLL